MIRTLLAAVTLVAATVFYGGIAIGASVLRLRGGVYGWATQSWARAILRGSGVPVAVCGGDHVRSDRARIVVANHVSWYDIFILAAVLPRPLHFVGKKELDRIPFFGRAWRAAGHISIDRSDRRSAVKSLDAAGERIRAGAGTVIIFAEGTRSRDGRLQRFKKGAFGLANQIGVPVVPATITGSFDVLAAGRWRVRSCQVRVHFDAPVEPGPPEEPPERLLRAVESRIRARLSE